MNRVSLFVDNDGYVLFLDDAIVDRAPSEFTRDGYPIRNALQVSMLLRHQSALEDWISTENQLYRDTP